MADHTYNPNDCKQCRICGETKYCSEFPRSPKHLKGCRNECKVCKSLAGGHRPRIAFVPAPEGMMRCTKCNGVYPATKEFFRWEKKRGLRNLCKQCAKVYTAERKKTVAYSEWRKRYYSSPEVKAKTREYRSSPERLASERKRQSRPGPKEYRHKYNQEHKEQRRENYRNNPVPQIIKSAQRRDKVRSREHVFSQNDWRHGLDYFNNCCAACGRPVGLWHTLAQDHWIPIARDGVTVATNIVPLCHGVDGCNNNKKDKDPNEWLAAKFGKRKAKQIALRIEQYFASVRK